MHVYLKMLKVTGNSDLFEVPPLLTTKSDELKQHTHTKWEWEANYKIKENLGSNIILNIGYTESCKNKQDTAQSVYFSGITNLWITPEPVRASQRHPKLPRAGKSHPRITLSQPEPARANQSQERANENLI